MKKSFTALPFRAFQGLVLARHDAPGRRDAAQSPRRSALG
jgi:hypothetical protein